MTRRLLALAAAGLLSVAVLGACSSDSSSGGSKGGTAGGKGSGGLTPFTVVLDWTPNTNHAGMYLAKANGWYEDAGLDVTFVEPGEAGSLQALAADKAQVAVSTQEDLTAARVAGLPVISIAAIIEHNTSSLATLASEEVERPKDLEGLTYGGYGGQLEQALIETLVECDGGDPKSLQFVDVGEEDYYIGLDANSYDVVWIFDGWDGIRLSRASLPVEFLRFAEYPDCIPDWYTPLLATSEQVAEDQPDQLKAFMEATVRGYQEAMEDPKAAATALLDQTDDLDPDVVEESAEYLSTRYADDPEQWGQQDGQVWDDFTAFLVDKGVIEQSIEVDDAWTNEYLPGS